MATKTYQADSMMEALQMIQAEIGPDAIVLSVRELQKGTSWQVWKRKGVEVVAMTPDTLSKAGPNGGTSDSKPANRAEPLVRPSADGKGFEFTENIPVIEWEGASAPAAGKAAPAQEKASRVWQPQHIRKEEVEQINHAALFRGDMVSAKISGGGQQEEFQPGIKKTSPAAAQKSESSIFPPVFAQLQQQLVVQGLEVDYVQQLLGAAMDVLPASAFEGVDYCQAYVRQQLEAELAALSQASLEATPQTIVLIGSSGSGKTATLAKLAYHYSLAMGKKVVWVSADTIRTGAIAETRAFTDALGLPLWLVYTPEDFNEVLRANPAAEVFLVDMPGYNPYSEPQMVDLGAVLTAIPNRTTYLVAAANTKEADLLQAVASLSLFRLKGLIFTKLDETFTFGSVFNLARISKLPVAFFCSGKEANGNLQYGSPARLVNALYGKGWMK